MPVWVLSVKSHSNLKIVAPIINKWLQSANKSKELKVVILVPLFEMIGCDTIKSSSRLLLNLAIASKQAWNVPIT